MCKQLSDRFYTLSSDHASPSFSLCDLPLLSHYRPLANISFYAPHRKHMCVSLSSISSLYTIIALLCFLLTCGDMLRVNTTVSFADITTVLLFVVTGDIYFHVSPGETLWLDRTEWFVSEMHQWFIKINVKQHMTIFCFMKTHQCWIMCVFTFTYLSCIYLLRLFSELNVGLWKSWMTQSSDIILQTVSEHHPAPQWPEGESNPGNWQ